MSTTGLSPTQSNLPTDLSKAVPTVSVPLLQFVFICSSVCGFICGVCFVLICFLTSPFIGASGGLCFVVVAFHIHLSFYIL